VQSTKSSPSLPDPRSVAGRAPMPAQGSATSRYAHASGGGFCVICGTVWPCSQAGKHTDLGSPPTRRPV
jgi:hypothetical protein